MLTYNNEYVSTSSLLEYKTKKIKRTFDTEIRELSSDGNYDYLPGPEFKLLYPNGGEVLWLDDDVNIQWYMEEPDLLMSHSIYCEYDNKSVFLSEVSSSSTSSYNWSIPNNFDTSSNVVIKLQGVFDDEPIIDTSDFYFKIDKRYITIDRFDDNIVRANVGNIFPISWKYNGIGEKVNIDVINYDTDELILSAEQNYEYLNTIYNWKVDNIPNTIDKVKIRITDVDHLNIFGISEIIDVMIPRIYNSNLQIISYSPMIKIVGFYTEYTFNPNIRIINFSII